jgi:DNA polymerase elongation subunit (family B)
LPPQNDHIILQLVHATVCDGLPQTLGADEETRFSDIPYALISKENENQNLATVCLFGVTSAGNSVAVFVQGYRPYIRVELPVGACTHADAEALRLKVSRKIQGLVTLETERLKRFYGWIPSPGSTDTRKFTYALLRFDSWKSAQSAIFFCEREGFCVTDKQVKPITKFMNDLLLTPSDWIRVQLERGYVDTKVSRMSNCQSEIIARVGSLKPYTSDSIAPLLVMSFDGEMFSHDGSFPSVLKGDFTICMGASFWLYGSDISTIKRFVLCVGQVTVPEDSDISVACFKSKRDMIEGFRDLIIASDPDIVTGWNTYGFDYPFLHEDYYSDSLQPWERGSEDIQVAAICAARAAMNLPPLTTLNTAATLLSKFRSSFGHYATREWLRKGERTFGSKNIATLVKLEKGAENGSLAEFGIEETIEEENGVSCKSLPAKVASSIRRALRELLGQSVSITTFATILEGATKDQLSDFWKRISLLGKGILDILQAPVAPIGADRGLFLGRIATERAELVEKRMSSAAKGDNTYYFWGMTGRINVDLMQIIKDDKKPDDNTLKYAAQHWLGGGDDNEKLDLSAGDMFAAYESGDPNQKWEIAKYCARDCDIPLKLINKLCYIPTWIEMSRVCYTWTQEVVNSGQQVKVFNLISRFVCGEYALNVRDSGWPSASVEEDDDDFKKRKPDYQGATVIEPVVGFYEDCVATLDFESLYPSIIRYFNLCPSVIVLDDHVLSIPGLSIERHSIDHNIPLGKGLYKSESRTYSFVNHIQGVLPNLLKRLLDARKSVKAMMNACEDPLQKAVLNGRQNGIKVACNSVYGFCGVSADRGLLPCKPVAAVTTLKGRAFIEAAKNYVEKTYPCKVIYGDTDSIMILFGKDVDVPEAARIGEEAAAAITSLLRTGAVSDIGGAGLLSANARAETSDTSASSTPRRKGVRDVESACSAVTLAYEKTYRPYLLMKKKNYAGIIHTSDGKGGFKTKMDMKGIDAVRRDRPKLLRDTSNAVLKALLYERSVPQAMKTLSDSLDRIASDGTPIDDFILSKSLKGNYASPNLPHVTAWKRMTLRGDEGIPPIGARMPYIVVVDKAGGGGKKSSSKLYERTEHPSYVKSAKLTIDRQYYVETLQNPIAKLLQFVVSEDQVNSLFRQACDRALMTSSRIGSLKNIANDSKQTISVLRIEKAPKRKREEPSKNNLLNFFKQE